MALAVGLSTVNAADAMLNGFRNTAFQVASLKVAIHTAIPGAAGTNAASAKDATKVAITFAASSGGALAITGTNPVWTSGSDGSETITHCSVWDGAGTTFLWSFALGASKTWTTTGDTLTLTACGLSLAPLATT